MPIIDLPQGRVQYRLAGPDNSAGPPVVLLHGLLVNCELWTKVADDLAARGIRSYALDLPLGSHSLALRPEADLSPRGRAAYHRVPRGARIDRCHPGGKRHRNCIVPVRHRHRRQSDRPFGADRWRRVRSVPATIVEAGLQAGPPTRWCLRADVDNAACLDPATRAGPKRFQPPGPRADTTLDHSGFSRPRRTT